LSVRLSAAGSMRAGSRGRSGFIWTHFFGIQLEKLWVVVVIVEQRRMWSGTIMSKWCEPWPLTDFATLPEDWRPILGFERGIINVRNELRQSFCFQHNLSQMQRKASAPTTR
jgi:hypothetical protein